MANLSLVLFTSFAQASVGMVVLLAVSPLHGASLTSDSIMKRISLAVALVLLGLGMLFSLLHLSDPLISFYSITNLGESWLSREILFAGLFGASTLPLFFMRARTSRSRALVSLAALFGLGFIFVMSKVYTATPVLFWNNTLTFWVFLSTALLLGASTLLLTDSIAGLNHSFTAQSTGSKILPLVTVAAAGLRVFTGVLQLFCGFDAPVRMDLVFIHLGGVGLALAALFLGVQLHSYKMNHGLVLFSFITAVLLWIAEIAGRIMFYEALSGFTL